MAGEVRVAVLGGGSWGTTVASLAANNARTILWARSADTVAGINTQHENLRYLQGLPLHSALRATTSVEEAVADADVLVTGVPSQALRGTLEVVAPVLRPGVPVVNLAKGLEEGTGKRMTEVINETLPGHSAGLLSGPNLAREVLEGYAAAAVIAMADLRVAESLQQVFASRVFRVYTNTDVLGCELGGTLKNVVAIAAGLAEGLGVGDNTRSLVITRGLAEMTRLGSAFGAQPRTFAGLTGLGDLMATCLSPLSRNRRVGEELAKGHTLEEVIRDLGMVAEGVKTTPAVVELAHDADIAVPVAEEVNAVLRGEHSAEEAYRGLRRVSPTSEIHGLA